MMINKVSSIDVCSNTIGNYFDLGGVDFMAVERKSRFDPNTFNTPDKKSNRQCRYDVRFGNPENSNRKAALKPNNFSDDPCFKKPLAQANFLDSLCQAPKKYNNWSLSEQSSTAKPKHRLELSQDRLRLLENIREVNVDHLNMSEMKNLSQSSPSRFNDNSSIGSTSPRRMRWNDKNTINRSEIRGFDASDHYYGVEEKLRRLKF